MDQSLKEQVKRARAEDPKPPPPGVPREDPTPPPNVDIVQTIVKDPDGDGNDQSM